MSSEKKFKYKPRSIREILSEMKDTVDLILDLAYSAILYNLEDVVDEVKRLERRMDKLIYLIRIETSLACRDVEDAERLAGILQIATASEVISDAAREIVNVVHYGHELDEIVLSALKKSDERIISTSINKGSTLINKSLNDIKLDIEIGMFVLAVRRKKEWFYRPDKTFILHEGDVLLARGLEDGVTLLKRKASGEIQ